LSNGKLQYYTLPVGGVITTAPLMTTIVGNFSYYVSQIVNGLESKRATFSVTMLDPNKLSDLQKVVSMPATIQENSEFLLGFKIYASNLTTQMLDSVRIEDNLGAVFNGPSKFQVLSVKSSGKLIVNPMYDGLSNTGLLSSSSQIPPLNRDSIELILRVSPKGFVGELNNQAKQTAKLNYGNFSILSNDLKKGPGSTIKYPTSFYLPLIDVFIPDAFTPNRDGFNDRFVIIHPFTKTIGLEVFNRWGQKVYANPIYDNEWDGKGVTNFIGSDLPEGTYFYVVEITEQATRKKEFRRGYITLKRQ
jgi:gliding motility-associated-like protein